MHHWSCHRSSKLQWRWIMTENAMAVQASRPQTPNPKTQPRPHPHSPSAPFEWQAGSQQFAQQKTENSQQAQTPQPQLQASASSWQQEMLRGGQSVAGGVLAGDVGVSTCNRRRCRRRRGRCHWHLTHTHFPACCSAAVALQLQLQLRGWRKAGAMSSCRQCDIICVYSVADKQKIIMRGVWVHRKKFNKKMLHAWRWGKSFKSSYSISCYKKDCSLEKK